MTQTQTPSAEGVSLYDTIMGEIEPLLVSDRIEQTKQELDDMSEDERKVVLNQFAYAFFVYEQALSKFDETLREDAKTFMLAMKDEAMEEENATNNQQVESLEQRLDDDQPTQ